HYRNLGKMQWVLDDYFRKYRFQSISEYLGVPLRKATDRPKPLREPVEVQSKPRRPVAGRNLEPVTLVVPLFNEEMNVAYLQRTLLEFRDHLARSFRIYLSLVDDGSTDGTWDALHEVFRGVPDCSLIRHQRNMGVAAAILTGIQEAPTEIVCSIDCDCSYDPNELERMIPLIEEADLVTASPYHPEGSV
ncbi:MAG: glycosyltransferase family 2 protein, partial [Myxococcales bacterium]|nr:glycosyltransferase family 2 protein [Myxococcales bacterium]